MKIKCKPGNVVAVSISSSQKSVQSANVEDWTKNSNVHSQGVMAVSRFSSTTLMSAVEFGIVTLSRVSFDRLISFQIKIQNQLSVASSWNRHFRSVLRFTIQVVPTIYAYRRLNVSAYVALRQLITFKTTENFWIYFVSKLESIICQN